MLNELDLWLNTSGDKSEARMVIAGIYGLICFSTITEEVEEETLSYQPSMHDAINLKLIRIILITHDGHALIYISYWLPLSLNQLKRGGN